MNKITTLFILTMVWGIVIPSIASVKVSSGVEGATLENNCIARVLKNSNGRLVTEKIVNKRAGTVARPTQCDEFRLRISQGTDKTGTDIWMTTADFSIQGFETYTPKDVAGSRGVAVNLFNRVHKIAVTACYELAPDDFYMRKFLRITSEKPVTLERIDVDVMCFKDAEQPYQVKCIYARGKWSPGLGQPLYTTESGTFWGIEFPAAYNYVKGNQLTCGYLWGHTLNPGKPYTTYKAVTGVSDDPAFNQECFFDYINRVRVRPLRLQVQYNSWFDFGPGVSRDKFTEAVSYINKKLVKERGCRFSTPWPRSTRMSILLYPTAPTSAPGG